MKALIDGDILVYKIGFGAQKILYKCGMKISTNEKSINKYAFESNLPIKTIKTGLGPSGIRYNIKSMVDRIVRNTKSDDYCIYVTRRSSDNYRLKLHSFIKYKENRKDARKPLDYDLIRSILQNDYKTVMVDNQEADDALGIEHYKNLDSKSTIICTIDKDLNMIPGLNYNLNSQEIRNINPTEAIRFFYKQFLIGDKADNIPGISGLGPVKSGVLLDKLTTEEEMCMIVTKKYREQYGKKWASIFLESGQMLWIRRQEDEIWAMPKLDNENITEEKSDGS